MSWLEQFGHGGDLLTAAERFGFLPEELLDFSANINPLGPPQSVLDGLREALSSVVHYPDPAHRAFRRVLAEKLHVSPEWILPANGAAEAMALAILALQPETVGVVYPCFSEYAQLSKQFGARVTACYGRAERAFKPDMPELEQLFHRADMVFAGSPNNPTGILYEPEELLQMAVWTETHETCLIVDEAFLDFVPPHRQYSLLAQLQRFPRVVLIRSMTKMFAIPGLRLGYALGHPAIIERMKQKQVTWSVNRLALLAGELCLREADYEQRTRRLISSERAYLIEAIESQPGWTVWPGEANFLLVRCPVGLSAGDVQSLLGKKGILIRNCAMYPGLGERDFRIAVRTRAENNRLLAALHELWTR
jgi:threonine-phosphate decarboxylase